MELSDDQSTHTANDEYGRLNPNSLLGGLFFVVSLVFLFYVIPNYINLPPYMQHPLLSPRFLPQLAGWLVLILAFVLMVNGLLYPPKREEADELRQGVPVLRQVLMLAAGAIHAVFFEQFGAIGSGIFASVLLFMASGLKSAWIYVLAVLFPVVVSLLFIHVLNVPLPVGTLWEALLQF